MPYPAPFVNLLINWNVISLHKFHVNNSVMPAQFYSMQPPVNKGRLGCGWVANMTNIMYLVQELQHMLNGIT